MVNLPPIHEKDVDLQADLIGKYLGAKGIPTNQQWWATDPDTINNSLPTKVLSINCLAYDSLGKIIPESLIMAVKPVNDADIIPPGVGERTAYGMAAVTKVYDVSADRKSYKWELKGVCCGGYGELYNNHFVVPKYPGLLAYEIDAKSEPVPEVGFINSLVASGKYLFAGTPFGIYRSSDNGINWIQANSGITNPFILSLAVIPNSSRNNIFASSNSSSIYLSADEGSSWTSVSPALDYFHYHICSLAVNKTNIYACIYGSGVYLSSDNGTSWTQINIGLTNNLLWSVAALSMESNRTKLFASTFNKGMFQSINNGANWTQISSGLSFDVVNTFTAIGNNLFIGTSNGVFLSTDEGIIWKEVDSGLTNTNVNTIMAIGNNLFAGTLDGVFLSTNNGINWSLVGTELKKFTSIMALTVNDKYLFCWNFRRWCVASSFIRNDYRTGRNEE
ncbi:MAG: hypothetical protein M1480_06155 [Bacteroidetes bacterium]|nr:hypothetical protein [Bacteroidota bacterium]